MRVLSVRIAPAKTRGEASDYGKITGSAGEEDERNKCEWTVKGNEEVHVERGLGAMVDEQDELRRRG